MRINLAQGESPTCLSGVVAINLQLSMVRYRMKYGRTEEFPLGRTYGHHPARVFSPAARTKLTPLLPSGGGTGTLDWGAPGSAQGLPPRTGGVGERCCRPCPRGRGVWHGPAGSSGGEGGASRKKYSLKLQGDVQEPQGGLPSLVYAQD